MILIVTATDFEARPIIDAFGLRSVNGKAFRTYSSDEFLLVVSGAGKILSASAVAYAFGKHTNISGTLNFGIAGSLDGNIPVGTLAVANAFLSAVGEKAIFPDVLFGHGLYECAVRTYDEEVRNERETPGTLVDMEAYGFASAAERFTECDRIASVKLVSDDATDGNRIDFGKVRKQLTQIKETLAGFITAFAKHCNVKTAGFPGRLYDVCESITEYYGLTVSQKNILERHLQDCYVTYGALPDTEKLPVPSGHGKKNFTPAFEELLSNTKTNTDCVGIDRESGNCTDENRFFRHTYVEESILGNGKVLEIVGKLGNTEVVSVPHYKSVFNRPKQNVIRQSQAKNLILAKATGTLLYEGSDYCSSFGFGKFYYCSTVIGCVYNCEYCYLQGMYPTANITAFINTDDFFKAIDEVDDGSPMLVCCSYDSDIVALDGILKTVQDWLGFARTKPNVTFEIRTKCSSVKPFEDGVPENVIIAYTLSPDGTDAEFEHNAPPTRSRIKAAETLADKGVRVRLCLEPCLCPAVKKEQYLALADEVIRSAGAHRYEDIVIGGFRMNKPYFNGIRAKRKDSRLFYSPFAECNGNSVSYAGADEIIAQIAEKLKSGTSTDITVYK